MILSYTTPKLNSIGNYFVYVFCFAKQFSLPKFFCTTINILSLHGLLLLKLRYKW